MPSGLNHVTLAVSDVQRSLAFYAEVLRCVPRVKWQRGAYLQLGELWLCLSLDQVCPAQDYTHYAFSIEAHELPGMRALLKERQVPLWKDNRSEGESLYFLDPDGHKLEVHVGDLHSRLAALRDQPYDGLEWLD
ncbi:fosfomycin resistance glutathione transferase [Pokkaliibacter plantistimulans]|uniref:Fosfomycin resistance glutathione transferase n=1 Tax=Proteobacteria bacterium 228 TaxID=2083153 RepID=A0A2S5KV35_9PROT|nr:fosfomycin resistance glutathione transferase [Pokkaliibacter plantistimulans]PPC78717.1 fosfomycin resistance glutathione transferase [Pokkaliibacter plantistimulans]